MADHELVWEYTSGTVTPRPECHADPATADCRIKWDCQCETWADFGREENGRPYHLVYVGSDELVYGENDDIERVRHYGKQGDECSIIVWMENDEELIESSTDAPPFIIGRTPFEPVFNGDYYEWRPEVSSKERDSWRHTLEYAATALEGSADNGDRHCAHQIRVALAEKPMK